MEHHGSFVSLFQVSTSNAAFVRSQVLPRFLFEAGGWAVTMLIYIPW